MREASPSSSPDELSRTRSSPLSSCAAVRPEPGMVEALLSASGVETSPPAIGMNSVTVAVPVGERHCVSSTIVLGR